MKNLASLTVFKSVSLLLSGATL